MENPFRKKYTREKYDKAEEEGKKASEEAKKHPGLMVPGKPTISHDYIAVDKRMPREHPRPVYRTSAQERKSERADIKIQRLKIRGEKEAYVLEANYKKLVQKVEEAKQALLEFEKDKLGISEE